jgi:putative endonuclease
MTDWYLYMVRCHDGSLYTGISTDVGRRFSQHQGEGNSGSKYLKGKGPLTPVFEKKVGSKSLALKVEGKIKKLPKAKKERLIEVPGYIEEIVRQVSTVPHQPHTNL